MGFPRLQAREDVKKPTTLTDIQRVESSEQLVEIRTNRANLHVDPDHRIPFTTKSIARPRIRRAGDLWDQSEYKFINDWQRVPYRRLETVDLTELLDAFEYEYELCAVFEEHGHTVRAMLPDDCTPIRRTRELGYVFSPETFDQYQATIEKLASSVGIRSGPGCRVRPYRFDADDFIDLVGWFVTEGSVQWSDSRDTATVQIAQKTSQHRQSIQKLFERLQIPAYSSDTGFRIGSKLYGHLFESLCGAESQNKRLPGFVWTLSSTQQARLLDTLLRGDADDRDTYYTTSEQLAGDVLRLCLEQGMNPQYQNRGTTWRIYVRTKPDGFIRSRNLRWISSDQPLYRLTVDDYSAVLAGRDGKFQWIGVSQITC